MPAPQRLLVRGVNWLGDAVMTTPALQRLREKFPHATITLLTREKISDLWRDQRCVDEVLTFAPGETPWAVGRRLRAGAFDTALILPNSPRSALEVWLTAIPRRVGYGASWRKWLLTDVVQPRAGVVTMRKRSAREIRRLARHGPAAASPQTAGSALQAPSTLAHQLHHYLHLAAALGAAAEPLAPALQMSAAETGAARAKWLSEMEKIAGGESLMILGLNPSAAYGEAKCWPVENFAAVAREVSQRAGPVCWVVLGTRDDYELCERLRELAGVPILNLAGRTSLRELMGLLKSSRVMLTNDSGPMHVAAALGTPVVVPFGSTSPELTGPGLPGDPRHKVLRSEAICSPCFRRTCPIDFRCMRGISVTQVTDAVLAVLQRGGTV